MREEHGRFIYELNIFTIEPEGPEGTVLEPEGPLRGQCSLLSFMIATTTEGSLRQFAEEECGMGL